MDSNNIKQPRLIADIIREMTEQQPFGGRKG